MGSSSANRVDPSAHSDSDSEPEMSKRSSVGSVLKKYFKEGQLLSTDATHARPPPPENSLWLYKAIIYNRPRIVGLLIPAAFFHIIWWSYMIPHKLFYLFEHNWYASVTMIFGSMIAGATSEGGASVAFPVLTLVFKINPTVARDFGLMIQTAGMTSATFTILYQQIKLEWRSIVWCTLGGIPGICVGLASISPTLSPPVTKIAFVSVWMAFAAALLFLNLSFGRTTFNDIPSPCAWKCAVLFVAGFFGGIMSGITGSGIDICSFAILTLIFRVSEKVATPTSVVLMAINTSVGFFFKNFWLGGMAPQAWEFLAVCVPIVVFGAPIGAFLGSYCHRHVLAGFIYVLDTVQYIGGMVIVIPKQKNPARFGGISVAAVIVGWFFFYLLNRWGQYLLNKELEKNPADGKAIEDGEKTVDAKSLEVSTPV